MVSRCGESPAGKMMTIARPFGNRVEASPATKGLKRQLSKSSAEEASPAAVRPRQLKLEKAEQEASAVVAIPAVVAAPAAQVSPALQQLEAVVVNLERRPDRMDGCTARLQAYCPWLRASRFIACDGKKTVMSEKEVVIDWSTANNVKYQRQRSIRKGWNDLDTYEVRDLKLSAGERGCAISHVRAWEHCLERAGDTNLPLLVLEDDAAPTPEFTATLERAMRDTPEDAQCLYLGYSQAADWKREVSADVVESIYVWTTVAYIIWPAGARLLLNQLPVNQPVDNWMATLAAEGDFKAYCVRPKIVRQDEAWNVNSDVGHSDECYWGPSSDIHHSDDLYWGLPDDRLPEPEAAPSSAVRADRFLASGSLCWDIGSDDSEDDVPKAEL